MRVDFIFVFTAASAILLPGHEEDLSDLELEPEDEVPDFMDTGSENEHNIHDQTVQTSKKRTKTKRRGTMFMPKSILFKIQEY